MKNAFYSILLALGLGILAHAPASAQLSLDLNVGYGVPTEDGSNGIWGGGLALKYFVSPKVAIGARIRTYAETIKQEGSGLSGELKSASIPIMGTIEYHPTTTKLNPYIGLEAGIIRTALNANISFNGQKVYDDTSGETNVGIAPKVGIGYNITPGIALTAEALYNVSFGKNQAGDTQYNLESSSKFLSIHAGVSFTFGNRFK